MRVFNLANDDDCLGEVNLIMLHREYDQTKLQQRKVKTLTGISLRWFAEIQAQKFKRIGNGSVIEWEKNLLADWVTGTLYTTDGDCCSSNQLKIIETEEKPYCSIKDMIEKFEYGRGEEYEIG